MRIGDTHYRSIWLDKNPGVIRVIDQRKLPFEFEIKDLISLEDACFAIREMVVRGAPLIGVTAAYGLYLAGLNSDSVDWCDEVKKAADLSVPVGGFGVWATIPQTPGWLLNSLSTSPLMKTRWVKPRNSE